MLALTRLDYRKNEQIRIFTLFIYFTILEATPNEKNAPVLKACPGPLSPMDHSIRLQIEERETASLAPYAALSRESKGRLRPEEECPIRGAYQRDRDRIIHCKSFRRLKHKTQVFLAPTGDHYRTRLTHVLEVSQIARTISVALRLNGHLT